MTRSATINRMMYNPEFERLPSKRGMVRSISFCEDAFAAFYPYASIVPIWPPDLSACVLLLTFRGSYKRDAERCTSLGNGAQVAHYGGIGRVKRVAVDRAQPQQV